MVNFADRMANIKASDIRELLKIAARPDIISFAGGLPAPELFPVEDMKTALDAVMTEQGRVAMQYGPTDGNLRLREQICERVAAKNNIHTDPGHVFITAGSQQGLDFLGKLFLNPGDYVVLESPSYLGAINAFKQYQPNFVSVQNPSGRTWPLERRKQFMEIINKYGVPAIEDNPYGDLRFKGEYLPSLKSMDTEGLIVYFGSFSKILSPGFRVGWIIADEKIVEKVNHIAQAAVLQTATINMMAIAKYMDMFDIDAHVAKILPVYKHRCGLMIETMRQTFPKEAKFTDPDGGLFTWVELPEYVNTRELAPQAMAQKVAYVPGSGFYPKGDVNNGMRLNYSCSTDEKIVKGINILADVIKGALK